MKEAEKRPQKNTVLPGKEEPAGPRARRMPGSNIIENGKYHHSELPFCFMFTSQLLDCNLASHLVLPRSRGYMDQAAVDINLHRMGPQDSSQKHIQSSVDVLTRDLVPEPATAVVSNRPTLCALGGFTTLSPWGPC